MRFKLEDWLKNYKPRVVGTNRVTKKNNVKALRVSIGKARAVATKFRKGNRNLGHCVPITDPDTRERLIRRVKHFVRLTASQYRRSTILCGYAVEILPPQSGG